MESSDSDSENECFESAEESIDEDENDVNTKSSGILPECESEFSEHISAQCNTERPVQQPNEDVSGNLMSYRKRPERVKHVRNKPSNKPPSKSSDEQFFKADKIVSDVFLQDITSNLTKNINKSLSTLQQTSSNVKELILGAIPMSSCSNNEGFSYDDKNSSSTSPHTFQDNKHFEFIGNMGDNMENKEEMTQEKAKSKEKSLSLADGQTDHVQDRKLLDITSDDLEKNLSKIQKCDKLEGRISEDFVKEEGSNLGLQQQALKNPGSTFSNSDLVNEEFKDSIEHKTKITTDGVEHSIGLNRRPVDSANAEMPRPNDQNGAICKENSLMDTINFSQNEKSQINKEMCCELRVNKKESKDEENSVNEKLVSHEMFSNSDAIPSTLTSVSESAEDNESLVTSAGKGIISNLSKEKLETEAECNLKELKTALKNIIKEEKSSFKNVNKSFDDDFEEGKLVIKGKNVGNQSSEEGWDDFDFSELEIENENLEEDNVRSTDLTQESKHIGGEQIKADKRITSNMHSANKVEEQVSGYLDCNLREGNLKTDSVKSSPPAAADKSSVKNLMKEGENAVRDRKKNVNTEIIEIKSESNDGWDWDAWDEEPEQTEKTTGMKGIENPDCKTPNDDSVDMSKWSGWDNFGQKSEEKPRNWSLGSWGVDALLNKATSVTQGISNVLEAGLGAPDPETLARMEKMKGENMKEWRTDETEARYQALEVEKKNSLSSVNLFPVSGITSLVAGVTSKIVEHSKIQEIGSKVITGGLDTLETFGKKTMEVLQEGDPGLKNKRALLLGDQKPVLSQVLKEAREKAERELKKVEERELAKKCNFETLFDDFQGMVHLEALEMLSRQYELKLEQLRSGKNSEEQEEFDAILEEVEQLCSLDECEMNLKSSSKHDFKIKLQMAVEPLKNEISIQRIIKIHEEVSNWLQTSEVKPSFSVINQKLVSTLAELAAATVQQFHKSGELLSVKECRKTVEEVDALLRLTNVLCTEINTLCEKFMLLSKERNDEEVSEEKSKSLSECVTSVMTNSTSYIRQAFNLLIPVLQFGAAVY